MDDDALVERLRAGADQFDDHHTDVDALVGRAVREGRRHRTRRRIVGAAACAVVAGAAIVALGGLPLGLRGGPSVVPAAPAPQSSASSIPAATPAPTPAVRADQVSGSPTDVKKTLTGLLPSAATVTHASTARDKDTNGFAWENTTALTVRDAKGNSYVFGGIGNGMYEDGCFNLPDCTKSSLPGGGTLWITSSPSGDKSGVDRTLNYNRPDGGHIWITERNYGTGGGPVTRNKLLLSEAAARALVTSPAWDKLF